MDKNRDPGMRTSNEASSSQLQIGRQEGDAYGRALEAMAEESGARTARVGDVVVAFVEEDAEGLYALEGGRVVWREAPEEANCHLEVAVADADDGRFVPGLDVQVTVLDGDLPVLSMPAPFLWHPFLHHYGGNARLGGPGPYRVRVHIEPAAFLRHDPVNGKRYGEPIDVTFDNVTFELGRKPSPEARPRQGETAYARSS